MVSLPRSICFNAPIRALLAQRMQHPANTPLAAALLRELDQVLGADRAHDLERAETLRRQVLQQHRGEAPVLQQLGILLHRRGRFDDARQALSQAERIAPDRVEFLLDHARILLEQRRPAEAVIRFRRAQRLQPRSPQAVSGLAQTLVANGQWPEAQKLLAHWLERHPDDHAAWLLLGDLHSQVGDLPEALSAWRMVRTGSRELAQSATYRIGNLQLRLGEGDAAWQTFSEAAGEYSEAAWPRCGLAAAASERADFEVMRREAEQAVAMEELSYTAWYQLTMTPEGCTEEAAHGVRNAIARAGANPEFWLLHMALGRILDRLGQHDEAFAAFTRAHALKSRLPGHQYRDFRAEFARARSSLGCDFIERTRALEPSRTRPIFIVGMPRSGTTLIEAILASHPAVAAGGEMRLVGDWVARHGGTVATADVPGWIGGLDRENLATLREAWQRSLRTVPGAAGIVTDKLPENFLFLGALAAAFPDAGFVYARRNGLDTCISCFTTALAGRRAASLPTLESLGGYYREATRLMDFWKDILPPRRIVEVPYEDLVREPDSTIRRLLSELGLPWDSACLDFHEVTRSVSTASVYQVRRPINTDSMAQWRRFATHLGPLKAALGENVPAEEHG